jgi:hypothetical protein
MGSSVRRTFADPLRRIDVSKRRLVAILVAAALTTGASLAIYRVFLMPTQAVEVELVAGVDPQVVAKQIAGSAAVAYNVPWCGGAGPSPEMAQRFARTYYININRGGEADALRRAQQIAGVRQAWLVTIPGPCPNNLV